MGLSSLRDSPPDGGVIRRLAWGQVTREVGTKTPVGGNTPQHPSKKSLPGKGYSQVTEAPDPSPKDDKGLRGLIKMLALSGQKPGWQMQSPTVTRSPIRLSASHEGERRLAPG